MAKNLSVRPPWEKDEWTNSDESVQELLESKKFIKYFEEYFVECSKEEVANKYLPVVLGSKRDEDSLVEEMEDLLAADYGTTIKFEMMMSLDSFCVNEINEGNIESTEDLENSLDTMRSEMILLMIQSLNSHYGEAE